MYYRKLNDVMRKKSYLLPCIDDNLEPLRGKIWFCTLHLASGYWHIKMHDYDIENTAFATHIGLYEINQMAKQMLLQLSSILWKMSLMDLLVVSA